MPARFGRLPNPRPVYSDEQLKEVEALLRQIQADLLNNGGSLSQITIGRAAQVTKVELSSGLGCIAVKAENNGYKVICQGRKGIPVPINQLPNELAQAVAFRQRYNTGEDRSKWHERE